jgi:hypothetical protein
MAEFSYSKRGLSVTQYSEGHVACALHAQRGNSTVDVSVSHHPQSAEGAQNPCHEFYSVEITHRQDVSKSSGDFSHRQHASDAQQTFLDRDAIRALHAALGEVLEQSEGLSRGAASVSVQFKASDFIEVQDD